MATETTIKTRPVFTTEQKEAWKKAKLLLKTYAGIDTLQYRSLHVAMSELRSKYRQHKGPIEVISKNSDKAYEHRLRDLGDKLRERIDTWKEYFNDPGSKKLYVICDNTLSDSQKAVQSAHAVAQFQKDHPFAPWTNGTLILLTPENDCTFYRNPKDKVNSYNLDKVTTWYGQRYCDFYTEWREPDMNNEITAIAVMNNFGDISCIRSLKLL